MANVQSNLPWAAKLDWHEASFDLTLVCRSREQVRCHKAFLAAASPFISFLLQELGEQPDAVLFLDEVEAVHLRSLLSLLYKGWADAESTGGLIQLWKQLGITVVRLAPLSIQVVKQSSINVVDDIFLQTRSCEDTLKESERIALCVDEGKEYQETRIAEVDVEELNELIKDAEVEDIEVDFEELEKGRAFKVKAGSTAEKARGVKRNRGAEEGTTTRKRERLFSKEEALPKEKKREIVVKNLEEREKEELRVEQVKVETDLSK